jgi:hypothetical protein
MTHSAASHVSLKSAASQLMQPMSQAAFTGSSSNWSARARALFKTVVPGTIGPRCLEHSGKPLREESTSQRVDGHCAPVSYASALLIL